MNIKKKKKSEQKGEKTHISIETSALKKQQKTEKITATTTTKAKQTKHKNKENSAYTVKKTFSKHQTKHTLLGLS